MKKKELKCLRVILFVLVSLSTTACDTKYDVKGRVVDAVTNQPVQGASIAIDWTGQELGHYIAPYASGEYLLEKTKTRSDKDGYFTIPKYPLAKTVDMGVYKKGYVCWSSNGIFQKGQRGLFDRGSVKKRKGFDIENGMVIKLEPFTDEYHRPTHASFVRGVSFNTGGLEGIGEEVRLYHQYYIKK